jgi:L-lactate utilization protein LutC
MWQIRIKAFLLDLDYLTEKSIKTQHECQIGKWIAGNTNTEFMNLTEMQRLIQIHENLHNTLTIAIRYKNDNLNDDAQEAYETIEQISGIFVRLLDKIELKWKKAQMQNTETPEKNNKVDSANN